MTRQWLAALVLAAGTMMLYWQQLERVPPNLSHDEVIYSLHAKSIAATGRDVNGRLMPLFFQVAGGYWATPVSIYVTAAMLTILPLTETVVRMPNVIIGALDVGLVYLLTLRISKSQVQALVAAVLFALTPAHLIHARMAGDLIYPLPFLLASLLCLTEYFEKGDRRLLFIGSALMGVGCYTYLGAAVVAPLVFVVLCIVIVRFQPAPLYALAIAVAGFAVPLLALVPWLIWHPGQFSSQIQMYGVYDAAHLNPLAGLLDFLSFESVSKRAVLYYQGFNPSYLFLGGDSSLMNSTRAAGVLLWPTAVFLPIGINHIINRDRSAGHLLVLAVFVLAPVAVLMPMEVKINRELLLLPAAAMISACGALVMLRARNKIWAVAAIVLLAVAVRSFVPFYRDYLTEYRVRASFWFDRNIRGGLEDVISRDRERPISRVYISRTTRWIDWYWKWYLAKHRRPQLLARTVYTVPAEIDPAQMPPHSVVFGETEEMEASTAFKTVAGRITRIPDPDGKVWFVVFERE